MGLIFLHLPLLLSLGYLNTLTRGGDLFRGLTPPFVLTALSVLFALKGHIPQKIYLRNSDLFEYLPNFFHLLSRHNEKKFIGAMQHCLFLLPEWLSEGKSPAENPFRKRVLPVKYQGSQIKSLSVRRIMAFSGVV